MRVLVVTDWYPSPDQPAVGTFVRDQVLAAARSCDVTVVALRSGTEPAEAMNDGIPVVRLPRRRYPGPMSRFLDLWSLHATVSRLRREGRAPDLIHAHVFSAGLLAVLVARRTRLPVIVSEHLSDVLEERVKGWDALTARFAYRNSSLVCPVSTALEQALLRLEPRANSMVVENVVDIDLFARVRRARPDPPRTRHVLVVARLVRKKGVSDLLTAVRTLAGTYPGVSVEVIGDGPDRGELEELADGLAVSFVGSMPREEIAARMRQTDVLVVPSLVETFGISAVEGVAAGLRVVVTSVVPVADMVAAAGGIVTQPANPTALANALQAALENPRVARSPSIELLRERFGREAQAARWKSIYASLVEGARAQDSPGRE